jgi:hypothetical protein
VTEVGALAGRWGGRGERRASAVQSGAAAAVEVGRLGYAVGLPGVEHVGALAAVDALPTAAQRDPAARAARALAAGLPVDCTLRKVGPALARVRLAIRGGAARPRLAARVALAGVAGLGWRRLGLGLAGRSGVVGDERGAGAGGAAALGAGGAADEAIHGLVVHLDPAVGVGALAGDVAEEVVEVERGASRQGGLDGGRGAWQLVQLEARGAGDLAFGPRLPQLLASGQHQQQTQQRNSSR